jgi:hypothetical protein
MVHNRTRNSLSSSAIRNNVAFGASLAVAIGAAQLGQVIDRSAYVAATRTQRRRRSRLSSGDLLDRLGGNSRQRCVNGFGSGLEGLLWVLVLVRMLGLGLDGYVYDIALGGFRVKTGFVGNSGWRSRSG